MGSVEKGIERGHLGHFIDSRPFRPSSTRFGCLWGLSLKLSRSGRVTDNVTQGNRPVVGPGKETSILFVKNRLSVFTKDKEVVSV